MNVGSGGGLGGSSLGGGGIGVSGNGGGGIALSRIKVDYHDFLFFLPSFFFDLFRLIKRIFNFLSCGSLRLSMLVPGPK